MKKTVNAALMFALPIAIAGALFKIMHWPGTNILLIVGLSSVALVSLVKYSAEKALEGYVAGCTIALGCVGVLFKLMHWPDSAWMIRLAVAGAIVWAVLSFRSSSESRSE